MLHRLALLTAVLLLGALPGAAQMPCTNADDLAWLLAPAPESAAPVPQPDWLFEPAPQPAVAIDPAAATIALASTARKPGGAVRAFCSEDCDALPDISCSGQQCSAVSRNCSIGQRGYVVCDGNYTYCAEECEEPSCTPFQCRQPCMGQGCFAYCVSLENCECDIICN